MVDVEIKVLDTRTNKEIFPDKRNTFWDNGKLLGIQDFYKIVYHIELCEEDEKEED